MKTLRQKSPSSKFLRRKERQSAFAFSATPTDQPLVHIGTFSALGACLGTSIRLLEEEDI
ncbi:MAG TPA: hypothetical protein VGQ81_17185 [Acidobacteriota bacterium]|nr:hypothetical protein [Acidobacteriota bacterium]